MNLRGAVLGALIAMGGAAHATLPDAKDDLKAAIRKLSQAGSYSWTIASTNAGETAEKYGFASGEGRLEKGGLTWLRTNELPPVEVVVKGGKMAVRLDEGWALERELAAPGGFRRHPNLSLVHSLRSRSRPAAEATELLKHVKTLGTGAEGYYVADLGPEDAKGLLLKYLRTSGRSADVTYPGGSLAFWVQDGILVKYETRLRGTVTFSAPVASTWSADQVTTVSLSSLGTARIDVPEDVKRMVE